jgi:hypothetical protein
MAARYMTLAHIFIQPTGTDSARSVPPGVEIGYAGIPTATLYPLNAAARQAEADLLARRNDAKKALFRRDRANALRCTPKHLRRRCEAAAAEAKHDAPGEPAPASKPRRTRSPHVPATYPGTPSATAGRTVGHTILRDRADG